MVHYCGSAERIISGRSLETSTPHRSLLYPSRQRSEGRAGRRFRRSLPTNIPSTIQIMKRYPTANCVGSPVIAAAMIARLILWTLTGNHSGWAFKHDEPQVDSNRRVAGDYSSSATSENVNQRQLQCARTSQSRLLCQPGQVLPEATSF